MHTVEIPDINQLYTFPSELEEFNEQQYLHFVDLVLRLEAGHIDLEQFKSRLLFFIGNLKVSVKYIKLPQQQKDIVTHNIFLLSELMESFFEDVFDKDGTPVMAGFHQQKRLKTMSLKNFIPRVAGKYYGPQDAIRNISFCEYRSAHSFFSSYLETKNEDDLNHLIAVLYRRRKPFLFIRKWFPGFDGQIRQPFTAKTNPGLLEMRTYRIAKLAMNKRYGIFLFWAACEKLLQEGTIKVDGNPIHLSVLYERQDEQQSESPPSIGLVGVLYTLAENKVFGSVAQTDNTNLFDIIARLYQVVMQSKQNSSKNKPS